MLIELFKVQSARFLWATRETKELRENGTERSGQLLYRLLRSSSFLSIHNVSTHTHTQPYTIVHTHTHTHTHTYTALNWPISYFLIPSFSLPPSAAMSLRQSVSLLSLCRVGARRGLLSAPQRAAVRPPSLALAAVRTMASKKCE